MPFLLRAVEVEVEVEVVEMVVVVSRASKVIINVSRSYHDPPSPKVCLMLCFAWLGRAGLAWSGLVGWLAAWWARWLAGWLAGWLDD